MGWESKLVPGSEAVVGRRNRGLRPRLVDELELAAAPKREAEYVELADGSRRLVSGAKKLTADEAA